MPPAVAAFTDTYLPTVNGATYTVRTWRERWQRRGGRMDVVYPMAGGHVPETGEHPVRSLPFPFYEGFRLGAPRVPDGIDGVELVHVHTPFTLGTAGAVHASRRDLPLVASYHTPTGEYADYVALAEPLEPVLRGASRRWERRFFSRADVVLAPSESTRRYLLDDVVADGGSHTDVVIVPNGIDVERFRPIDPGPFRARHGLPDGPLVGYTGRHGHEKRLDEAIDACEGLAATLVFGGDGPARAALESRARDAGVDARFLGFLDRDELPAFYSALDVFLFPSPVETQGLVALEANACGTPVAAVDSGALVDTVEEGVTGYRYPAGNTDAFRACIRRCLADRDRLHERCLDRRDDVDAERAVDALRDVYADLL